MLVYAALRWLFRSLPGLLPIRRTVRVVDTFEASLPWGTAVLCDYFMVKAMLLLSICATVSKIYLISLFVNQLLMISITVNHSIAPN